MARLSNGSRFRAEPMAFGWGQKLVYEDVGIPFYVVVCSVIAIIRAEPRRGM